MTKLNIDMINKSLLILGVSGLLLTSCTSCSDPKEKEKEDIVETDTIKKAVLNVGGELFSVPSPIQTAMLIKDAGVDYDKSILNDNKKVNTFSTDYLRALNLGIYGADLGYVSLYNKSSDAIGYLASVKQLADKIGVSAAFDATTIKRIENNITNKDSMLVLVGIAYRASDAYLKNNQRTEVSSLILAGGWIESMQFSLNAYSKKPSPQIKYRIAEQKQALASILKLLKSHNMPDAAVLVTQLEDLSKVYEGISFKYNYVEPVTDSIKRITYINSTTEVVVSEDQLKEIATKLEGIRSLIINATKA
jgi:hypothetical protein